MKKLYISDMDGTLLKSDGTLSEYSKQKINDFYNRDILFSVATARSSISVADFLKDVRLNAPIVLMNGVFVYDFENKKAVKYYEIEEKAFLSVVKMFEKYLFHPNLFLYGEDGEMYIELVQTDNEIMEWFYNTRSKKLGNRFNRVDDLAVVPKGQHPVYFSYFAPYEQLLPFKKEIDGIEGVSYAFYKDSYSDLWLIEIYSAEASKARGAVDVKKITGADFVVGFGDNLNDILLLENVDMPIAVENAVPELKKIAKKIIGDCDSDSVVKYIEEQEKKEL